MGETKDTGGPAFAHGNPEQGGHPGMDLRDWFAGQALMGISEHCASIRFEEEGEGGAQRVVNGAASIAYAFADAMLAHRNKETDNG